MQVEIPDHIPTYEVDISRSSPLAQVNKRIKNALPDKRSRLIDRGWETFYSLQDKVIPQEEAELREHTARFRFAPAGHIDDAIDEFEHALEILDDIMHMTRARILRSYGHVASMDGQHDKALGLFRQSLEEHGRDTTFHAEHDSGFIEKAARHTRISEIYHCMALLRAGKSDPADRKKILKFAEQPPRDTLANDRREVLDFILYESDEFPLTRVGRATLLGRRKLIDFEQTPTSAVPKELGKVVTRATIATPRYGLAIGMHLTRQWTANRDSSSSTSELPPAPQHIDIQG